MKMKHKEKIMKAPVIEFKGKNYGFSTRSLILFPIGTLLLSVLMIQFLEIRANFWLHEIIAKHAVFVLNTLFNLRAEAVFVPEYYYPWTISLPGDLGTYIDNGCTGIIAVSIFVAIIIFTPHSQESKTNEDIIWRKTTGIIAAVTLIYLFNVFRIALQNYLYYQGFSWNGIHDSLAALSIIVVVHIFIFLICNRHIPEFFISIYYSGKLIYHMRANLDPQKEYQKRY